ncbi:FAD-binding protein [Pelomonas sp. CA6]|uniref:FAD-binding protein n=1 Tax=Pelomonas sp. CA6 TaxID=2907999 RepID=UPI001F4C0B37|nr:FAD-binding protein [Pelomonas sp. CA6]MCH7343455.1 FAD-binding protein [Pelomonas sp. CA6]
MTRRIDPRRPATRNAQGLRRLVLGGTEGERDLRPGAHGQASARRPRLSGAARGCLMVIAQPEAGGLDEHACETLAAAALLAAPDEAVVALLPVPAAELPLQLDAAALGIDCLEILPLAGATPPDAQAQALLQRWQHWRPRLLLMPDRGDDADLGRRLAATQGLATAAGVVEIAQERGDWRARVRHLGAPGRAAGDATAALAQLQLLLLARHVARTELPFLGLGEQVQLPPPAARPMAGVHDLGLLAGQARQLALDEADFIIAAGNGVTDVALFHELAQALGASVGASRVAVDDGRFARSQQIGATGRTVQARGYLALGISGAVQHLQGIRECRHVMAVNTDPAAPIVQRSELTVAEDVQALMRALLSLLRREPGPSPAQETQP